MRPLASILTLWAGLNSQALAADAGAKWLEYGRLQMRANNYDSALHALTTAAKISPSDAAVHKELGNAYYYKGELSQARLAYAESLRLNPGDAALASFLDKLNAADSSRHSKPPAIKSEKRNWVVPTLMSVVLPGSGQFYNRRPIRGIALGVPTLALIGGVVASQAIGAAARDRYASLSANATQAEYDESYATWESMSQVNGICIILGIQMYLLTVVDAATLGPPRFKVGLLPRGFQASYALIQF